MSQGVKDFTAGVICGWTQVLIMQPFEIVKVRLQTQSMTNPQYKGPIDCLKAIILKQGPKALYKGTLAPLLGVGTQVSAQFGTNEFTKRELGKYNSKGKGQPLDYHLVALSGLITGLPSSSFAAPIQHVRIRMQVLKNTTEVPYSGSVSAAIYAVKNYGLKTLFLGFVPTFFRESFGGMLYFLGYQTTKRTLVPNQAMASPLKKTASYATAGGVAGICFWLITYPIDCIKTLMQTDAMNPKQRKYNGFLDTYQKYTKLHGFRSLLRGYSVAMARAVPVNAGGFLSFQLALGALGRETKQ